MTTFEQKTQEAAEHYDFIRRKNTLKQNDYQTGFIAGAKWARGPEAWISVEDGLPGKGQPINFIIDLPGSLLYHGKCYGGVYDSNNPAFPRATTPGYWWPFSHWQPMPQL